MSVVPVQAAGGRAPLALSTGSGHHWWDDPGPCPKPQETSWNHGVGRFFLWQFQPMLVGLAVHLTWVAFKSFQFAGPACLYTSDSILGVIRASDYPEQWAACQPLLSSADCERIGGSRGCAWNEERGICDVKQLAKSVDFVFLAPRLSHYMVTDVVYLYIFVFALMIWVTYYVLFRVWSYTSHLGVVSWLAVLTVWLYSLLCRGSYGLSRIVQRTGELLVSSVALFLFRPRAVPPKIMAKQITASLGYVATAFSCAMYTERIFKPTIVALDANNVTGSRRFAIELTLTLFFFSLVLPVGVRACCRLVRSQAWIAINFRDPTSRLSDERRYEIDQFLRVFIDHTMDMLRYAYGRGVLMRVAPVTVAAVVFKDLLYDLAHFTVWYHPDWCCFVMKLEQSKGIKASELHVPLGFRIFAKIVTFNRKVFRNELTIGIGYHYHFDCAARTQALSKSAVTKIAEAPFKSCRRRGAGGHRKKQNEFDPTHDLQPRSGIGKSKDAFMATTHNRVFQFANHRITALNIPRLEPFSKRNGNNIKAQQHDYPVRTEDIEAARPVLEFLQQAIFSRFQIRMQARLFAALVAAVSPLIAMLTGDAEFLPGFPRAEVSTRAKNVIHRDYITYILIFLITDVTSYLGVVFGCHLNRKVALRPCCTMLGLAKQQIDRCSSTIYRCLAVWAIFFSFIMVQRRWDPYEMAGVATRTGIPEVTIDHIRAACEEDPF